MKRIEIVGLNSERKRLIEYLQSVGCVDISDSREGIIDSRETAGSISRFESYMSQASAALEILPDKENGGMFSKRQEISGNEYSLKERETAEITALISNIIKTKKAIDKNNDEIAAIDVQKQSLIPFMKLDIPVETKGTVSTLTKVGTVEGSITKEEILRKLNDSEINEAYFEVLSSDKQKTTLWFMYSKSIAKEMESFFTEINFLVPKGIPGNTPEVSKKLLSEKNDKLIEENEKLNQRLEEYAKKRNDIELFYDKLAVRRDKYRALSNVGITKSSFFISGYVPSKKADALVENLKKDFTVSVDLYEPSKDEDVPKAFENNAFVAPVEGITADYSMPDASDIDPNPIMAIFYYFFFGMMFSDAGYGLLMIIVCGLLGFGNFMEKEKRRMFKMFFYCGISTTFWGLMYGSFFGDMIATVSNTFGSGKLALSPLLVDPVKKPLEVLVMSVAFGAIHILTALGVKLYMTWRDGDPLGAIFDSGFWMLVMIGAGMFAAGAALAIPLLKTIGMYMAIGAVIGLVLTQGRSNKNPIMKLFGGILSLYDITGYVGDLLSYSRLMALGLATGVIASVINVLGSLGGKSVIGLIAFIVISIFGHSLNFAINMLGAYVHTNRLQYVEFYQKFYEGGGRKFSPLSFKTKYYNFK